MKPVLVISARDNVATALEALDPGRQVRAGDAMIVVRERIPSGHKIAIADIPAGDAVIKYGSAIGNATAEIPRGAHVHSHNLASTRGRGDLGRRTIETEEGARLAEPPDPAAVDTSALVPRGGADD